MSDSTIEISVAELRQAFDAVVAHIESIAGSAVSVENDYFWSVPMPDRIDPLTQAIGHSVVG